MIFIGIHATMTFFNQYLNQENFKEKANGVTSACAKHSTDPPPPQFLFQTQAQTLGETRRKGFCIWDGDGPTGRAGPHYLCSPRTLFLGRKAPWGREPPTHSPDSGHAVIHLPSHPPARPWGTSFTNSKYGLEQSFDTDSVSCAHITFLWIFHRLFNSEEQSFRSQATFSIQAISTSVAPTLTAIFETDMALKEARITFKNY